MPCVRCGRTENIDKHHIKQVRDGGTDEPENIEELCYACHKYEHAKRKILATIKSLNEILVKARKPSRIIAIKSSIPIYQKRLEVLERLNTVEIIKQTGIYTSYWNDQTTHELSMPIPMDFKPDTNIKQLEFPIPDRTA